VTLCCAIFVLGCAKTASRPALGEEDPVRQTFAALQAALKARDADKVYALLDRESKADAERAAKAVQAAYAKALDKEKSEQEKGLGLSGTELAALTGPGFLKSKRFHGKYEELPDSKIDKVTLQGDKAVVNYTEADGDKEKLSFVRQEGQWKVTLPMPRVSQP
jgi:hypothetical protein